MPLNITAGQLNAKKEGKIR